jgi:hypothetical protein
VGDLVTKKYTQLVFLLTSVTLSSGCKVDSSSFGGTAEYDSSGVVAVAAKSLITSSSCIFHVDTGSATLDGGGYVSLLKNQVTTFSGGVTGPIDLLPGTATLATVTGSGTSKYISLAPASGGTRFASSASADLQSDSLTFVVVLKNTSRGDFLSFNPLDASNQAFELNMTSTDVSAVFRSSPSDSYAQSASLPTAASGTPLVIAAAFGNDTTVLDFSLNGSLQSKPIGTGTPVAPFVISRFLNIGSSLANQDSDIAEVYVFNRALTHTELGTMISYVASKNALTVKLDPSLSQGVGVPATDPNFAPAQTLIESKCITCHSSWSGAKASYYLGAGLVAKNSSISSKLYYRLSGSGGSSGPKTMPQTGSVSAADVAVIKTWIDGMP